MPRSPTELARRVISRGDVRALRELDRRDAAGDLEAKRAGTEVVLAKRRGSPGARRAIRVSKRRAVRKVNRSWEAGRLPGIERDVGRGPDTLAEWHRRTGSQGHERRQGDNQRRRGSRRQSGSSPPSDDPDEADLHLTRELAGLVAPRLEAGR